MVSVWTFVLLAFVVAIYVFVSIAESKKKDKDGKKNEVKRVYGSNETAKEAGISIWSGSISLAKGIWLMCGFIGSTIIDGFKVMMKAGNDKKNGKVKK